MSISTKGYWLIAVVVVLIIRFLSLSAYPLTDTTEARYGEIARVMATSGNWITPQLEIGVPFWAKPPLSFWQGALSVSLLGTSEFAVRLPVFLNILAVIALVYGLARNLYNQHVAIISVFIVITSIVGFVTSGGVMTDPAMVLSTTLAMVSFWLAMERGSRLWGYCFFIALALGFLAKGPVAWVLIGMPVLLWLTFTRQWSHMWSKLPVVIGIGIVTFLVVPWFVLSEFKTPGFLNYFFIGEHLQRFLDSGWTGDLYGTAHDEPRGTIWLFTLASFAPWSIVAIILGAMRLLRSRSHPVTFALNPSEFYLVLWCLWPSVFFTFSGNILPTYVLPALPAFAILLATSLGQSRKTLVLILPAILLPAAVVFAAPLGVNDKLEKRTQRALVQHAQTTFPNVRLAYIGKAPHSARFYSRGSAYFFSDAAAALAWGRNYDEVLITTRDPINLESSMTNSSMQLVGQWNDYSLYKVDF